MDRTYGFVIIAAAKDDECGIFVAGIGDFNGDYFDDNLIGADHAAPPITQTLRDPTPKPIQIVH